MERRCPCQVEEWRLGWECCQCFSVGSRHSCCKNKSFCKSHTEYDASYWPMVQFEGKNITGSKGYKFRCQLDKFDVEANAFTKELRKHTSSCDEFCDALISKTNGLLKKNDGKQSRASKKRASSAERCGNSGEPPKKKSKESNAANNAVEEEIANNFIGESLFQAYLK